MARAYDRQPWLNCMAVADSCGSCIGSDGSNLRGALAVARAAAPQGHAARLGPAQQ
jgi:hypothetical protein